MDTTTTARHRAVMATIADLIVAAAAGRTLRVAVGCTRPDATVFADQLTQALRARGRPGHCRTAKPKPVTTDGYTCARRDADGPSVAVITSGTTRPGRDRPVPRQHSAVHAEPGHRASRPRTFGS